MSSRRADPPHQPEPSRQLAIDTGPQDWKWKAFIACVSVGCVLALGRNIPFQSPTSMLCYSCHRPPPAPRPSPVADHRPGHEHDHTKLFVSIVRQTFLSTTHARTGTPTTSNTNNTNGPTLSIHPIPVAILTGYATVESDGKQVAGVKRLRG